MKSKPSHILSLTHGTLMSVTQLGTDKVQITVKDPDNEISKGLQGHQVRIVVVED